jgi:hypothetical protein
VGRRGPGAPIAQDDEPSPPVASVGPAHAALQPIGTSSSSRSPRPSESFTCLNRSGRRRGPTAGPGATGVDERHPIRSRSGWLATVSHHCVACQAETLRLLAPRCPSPH